MTLEEIKDFCIANAGKIASGIYVSSIDTSKRARVVGRIIAFKDKKILIEHTNGKNKLSDPLPTIPTKTPDGWHRVVSPCKVGFPVNADSVKLEEAMAIATTTPAIEEKPIKKAEVYEEGGNKRCRHSECYDGFCHREYSGVM